MVVLAKACFMTLAFNGSWEAESYDIKPVNITRSGKELLPASSAWIMIDSEARDQEAVLSGLVTRMLAITHPSKHLHADCDDTEQL
jgi:hypothetical protein